VRVTSPERPRKLALVLSGGGASGAFEAGVIEETAQALELHNATPSRQCAALRCGDRHLDRGAQHLGWLLNTLAEKGAFTPPAWLAPVQGQPST
jgi:hypothetical protein